MKNHSCNLQKAFLKHALPVIVQLLLDLAHDNGNDQVKYKIKYCCDHERHHGSLRTCDLLGNGKHLCYRYNESQRSILDQCDDFICHRRKDAFHYLRKDDPEKGLRLTLSQDLRSLVLSCGN